MEIVENNDIRYNSALIGFIKESTIFDEDGITIVKKGSILDEDSTAIINIGNFLNYTKENFVKDVSVLSDKLFSMGAKKVLLKYQISIEDYLRDKFIETGYHPLISRGWIPNIPNSQESYEIKAFITDILARRRTGSKQFNDILNNYDIKNNNILFDNESWVRYTPYIIKVMNEQDPDSFISNVLDIAYPISKRPPTSMSAIARSLKSMRVVNFRYPNPTGRPMAIEISTPNGSSIDHAIPVTRYSYGVNNGGYYRGPGRDYCGTFYYWEPSSHIYLIMGKNAYYPNKIAAMLALEPKNEILDEVIEDFIIISEKKDYVDKTLDYDIKYNEIIRLLTSDENVNSTIYSFDNFFVNTKGAYVGDEFYAFEDNLDQPLCIAARTAGYDTIIMSRMPGKRRIVSEILDTRNRNDSINNLVWEYA